MSSSLRISLLLASLVVFGSILFFVIKKKINIKYSIVWILWAIAIVLMVLCPDPFYEFAHLLGIEIPVNAVFLIMITLIYILVFYVYVMISKHNEEIIKLTYEISVLKKQLEDKNKKKK